MELNALLFWNALKELNAHLGSLSTSGMWTEDEAHLHISFLEVQAALLTLQALWDCVLDLSLVLMKDVTIVLKSTNSWQNRCVIGWIIMLLTHQQGTFRLEEMF